MERTPEQFLESLNDSANTISELAWDLGLSRRDTERGLAECVRLGWVVEPKPGADVPMPWGWAPYLMLSVEGEQALADSRAADAS